MKRTFAIGSIFALLLLTACQPKPGRPPAPTEPTVEDAEEGTDAMRERETPNVFYRGIVRPAGISIYMEGSHKLLLPDGRFILLVSDDLDLNGYVGEEVELFGAIRPTVEAGGIIMRVERINLVEPEEEPEDEVEDEEEDEETTEEPEEEDVEEEEPTEEPDEEDVEEEPTEEPEEEEEEPGEITREEPEVLSAEILEDIATLARQDYGAGNWTQEYCSVHIGFCIPVHKNWWYRSFGATSSSLWHVGLNAEEIVNLSDGPIQVRLLSGTIGSRKAVDGQVREQNGSIVGFKEWTANRHFEISAPNQLDEAVRFITNGLKEYVPEMEGN